MRSAAAAAAKASVNFAAMPASTMKRLAARHTWPQFEKRARTAAATAASRSASASTMKGSEPPSSMMDFLQAAPACAATFAPAAGLPVSVTAATRGSAMMAPMAATGACRFWNTPGGKPAAANNSVTRLAQPCTLGACFSRNTLPAISAEVAQRKPCHTGKIPRQDGQHRTQRQICDITAPRLGDDYFIRQPAGAMLGHVFAVPGRLLDFAFGFRQRLAHFQRDHARQPVAVLAQLHSHASQQRGAFGQRTPAPVPRSPRRRGQRASMRAASAKGQVAMVSAVAGLMDALAFAPTGCCMLGSRKWGAAS